MIERELVLGLNLTLEESYKLNGCFTREQCEMIVNKFGMFDSETFGQALDDIGGNIPSTDHLDIIIDRLIKLYNLLNSRLGRGDDHVIELGYVLDDLSAESLRLDNDADACNDALTEVCKMTNRI